MSIYYALNIRAVVTTSVILVMIFLVLIVVSVFLFYNYVHQLYPSVRPSICPSVTRWYFIKTAEHIVMLSSPHDSPFILVLCVFAKFRWGHPCGAAKQRWGMKMSQFSTNNLLSIHVTITAIVPGAYLGEAKMCKNVLKLRTLDFTA